MSQNISTRKVQYLAGFCVTLGYLHVGATLAWASPAIAKFRNGETDLDLTLSEESWIVSLQSLCGILGCLGGQLITDRIGRRKTILASAVPGIVGALIVLLATSAEYLYTAKMLQGISSGITFTISIIYLGEISDKEVRGPLGTLGIVMSNLGFLLMYLVGPFVTYNVLNAIVLALPIIFLMSAFWIPESPYFYLMHGRDEEAKQVYMYIKGIQDEKLIAEELSIIQESVKQNMANQSSMKELFTKREYRKPIYIITGLKVLQWLTGWMVIITYLQPIFQESGSMSTETASIIYGFVQLGASVVGVFLMRWFGRRTLLMSSSFGVALSMTALGFYFYFQEVIKSHQEIMHYVSTLPIISVIVFNIFYIFGIGTLAHVMQAELFPINVKTQASSSSMILSSILGFAVTKCYQNVKDLLGPHTVFWFFAVVAYWGIAFVYFCIPETKDKTLEEVQEALQGVETPRKSRHDVERQRF